MRSDDGAGAALASLNLLLCREFPGLRSHQVADVGERWLIMAAGPEGFSLGPRGTVSGPDQALLADLAGHVLVRHAAGLDASVLLRNLSMSFLNAPAPGILEAHAELLKLGTRLAEVRADVIDESQHIVSAAALTFSIR